jgi:alcohol dehydrogenase class IV
LIANFYLKTRLNLGAGSLDLIPVQGSNGCLIVNPKMSKHFVIDIERVLQSKGNTLKVITFGGGEPDSNSVNNSFEEYNRSKPDFIIAVGGGSLIDFAKGLSILFESGGNIEDYEFGERTITNCTPLYVIPTVYGSGSEVTPYTVINNSKTGRKFTLTHPAVQPHSAYIDPSVDFGIPLESRIISGIDAFIHCYEALISKQQSLFIQPFALEGIRIGWSLLTNLASGRTDTITNQLLALLSVYGGISIAHCRTGLIHTLSVSFAKYLPLPHGLLNALMVKYAVSHHLPHYNGLLANKLNNALQTSFENDEEAYNHIQQWFDTLIHNLAVEVKFLEIPDADKIVNRLMQDKGLPGVSHGPITEAHLRTIVNQIIDETRS